ncbi:uncharacterized protein BDR25DRAFT_347349 [Lindgomyces ingoldianus]|uniref:Uncharacterized protein n=1 Tax=Lindgomyces ingoldianus TaxID=673940 RepID=A0ACB6Q8S8_9PLEO|nr:uncharacterized protein BDR25DRAFT_347349 [Lindgomyces ingoldianus]KAF2463299.1 hypothetical protein BDR25DRAFT_347349 [Lindgomyces ingoldianus]
MLTCGGRTVRVCWERELRDLRAGDGGGGVGSGSGRATRSFKKNGQIGMLRGGKTDPTERNRASRYCVTRWLGAFRMQPPAPMRAGFSAEIEQCRQRQQSKTAVEQASGREGENSTRRLTLFLRHERSHPSASTLFSVCGVCWLFIVPQGPRRFLASTQAGTLPSLSLLIRAPQYPVVTALGRHGRSASPTILPLWPHLRLRHSEPPGDFSLTRPSQRSLVSLATSDRDLQTRTVALCSAAHYHCPDVLLARSPPANACVAAKSDGFLVSSGLWLKRRELGAIAIGPMLRAANESR